MLFDAGKARSLLLENYSKASCAYVKEQVLRQPELLKMLVSWLIGEDFVLAQRAAWVIGMMGDRHANVLKPYMDQLILAAQNPCHDAVARNVIRVWQFMDIDEQYAGKVYELCFNLLSSPSQAIAIRAFSATVCGNICCKYPVLADEIENMIPVWAQTDQPAMRVRLRDLSKKLGQLKR